jgi:hypothetical protein
MERHECTTSGVTIPPKSFGRTPKKKTPRRSYWLKVRAVGIAAFRWPAGTAVVVIVGGWVLHICFADGRGESWVSGS